MNGHEAGTVELPSGTVLQVTRVLGKRLVVMYTVGTNEIPAAVTDISARVSRFWVARLTIDGVTYENVRWGTVTPAAVSILHATGVATIPLWKLPPNLQKRFGYDPQETAQTNTAAVTTKQITGAFGVNLGTKVDVSQFAVAGSMEDETPFYGFTPGEPLAGIAKYYFLATPKTGIIYRIWAKWDCPNGEVCDDRQAILAEALRKKYNEPKDPDIISDLQEIQRGNREITCDCKGKIINSDPLLSCCYEVTLDYIDYDLQNQAQQERDDIQKQADKEHEKRLDNESKKINGSGL